MVSSGPLPPSLPPRPLLQIHGTIHGITTTAAVARESEKGGGRSTIRLISGPLPDSLALSVRFLQVLDAQRPKEGAGLIGRVFPPGRLGHPVADRRRGD